MSRAEDKSKSDPSSGWQRRAKAKSQSAKSKPKAAQLKLVATGGFTFDSKFLGVEALAEMSARTSTSSMVALR
jgi:hypothetical protein